MKGARVVVHLPADLVERLDKLAARLQRLPELQLVEMDRAAALQFAAARGLEVLESEQGAASARGSVRGQKG